MKNFPIIDKETGREYWISRSVAVLTLVIAFDSNCNKYILAVQRGKGTPDPEYVGKWCLPCGYLDYDENTKQAAQRELMEETGLNFIISDFKLIGINDEPKSDKRQNITFRYKVLSIVLVEDLCKKLTTLNSEKDEISDIRFIPIEEYKNYEWAFSHDKLLEEYEKTYPKRYKKA